MGLLLDASALLWALVVPARPGPRVQSIIAAPRHQVFVSAVRTWEIAIKVALGKLPAPPNLATWLPPALMQARFTPLAVSIEHTLAVELLPPYHRDPFDRLLVAQATVERLTIVTADPDVARYNVPVIRC
jgi:PIN domain nuclease of toxin-antitoxin system